MSSTGSQLSLPSLGGRSPVLKVAESYLRRAYYLATSLVLIVLLAGFGTVKYKEWLYEKHMKELGSSTGKKVVITYAQLGPPPLISGEEPTPQAAASRPSAPVIGVPKPVPDAEAAQETSPDQSVISGITVTDTSGGPVQVGDIPDINAFVPYEVAPEPIVAPPIKYPETARRLGVEGRVFIKVLIDLDGSVMKVVIVRGSGSEVLDATAVENAYKWKFSPALQNKNPVRVWIMRPVNFKLSEQ
jgi:TonB family protein